MASLSVVREIKWSKRPARHGEILLHLKILYSLALSGGTEPLYFPLMQHLICMPDLAHTHTHTPSWYPDNISVGTFQFDAEGRFCPPPLPPPPPLLFFFIFYFFSGVVQNVSEMFMRAGAGDKETDRCCLLMVDLSRWQYRTIFGTRESLSHVENVLCFDWRRGKERAASWKR